MIITQQQLPEFHSYSELLGYDPAASLFFDIETTGLSPSSAQIFLIGTIARSQDLDPVWTFTSYFAESAEEETEILTAFLTQASQYQTLIHFNGTTFDIPFINKKAEQYHLSMSLEHHASIDLYQLFRPLRHLLCLSKMKQRNFEHAVSYHREDQLTGKQMVTLYKTYLASKEPLIKDLLLLHNHDDLLGMTKLLSLGSLLGLLRGTLSAADISVCDTIALDTVAAEQPAPAVLFTFTTGSCDDAIFSVDYDFSIQDCPCHLSGTVQTYQLRVALHQGTLRHFFEDYKNYYYLPVEDQAIHKSVACYMDDSYREKAKASNCYIKKSGLFLPVCKADLQPAFRPDYKSKASYMLYEAPVVEQHKQELLASLLQSII